MAKIPRKAKETVQPERPKPRPNAISEEAGIDAARRLFRSNGWIYQEVEERNDFGKDAYVDLLASKGISGITIALQVKSGPSYRRKSGYRIPVKQHRIVWMESTVPVFGVVHDQTSDKLYWVNITQYLRDRLDKNIHQIVVPTKQILDAASLNTIFREAVYKAWDITQGAVFLLNLIGTNEAVQMSAVYDCRTLGQSEPRFIVLLRSSLRYLYGDALRAALWVLGHFVPSRRLWVGHMVWTRQARDTIRFQMYLDPIEIAYVMEQMVDDDWEAGQSVNELLWLVIDDPDGILKLKQALEFALLKNWRHAADGILQIICFLAGEQGFQRYRDVIRTIPGVLQSPRTTELGKHLEEHGNIYMFSFIIDDLIRRSGRISGNWPGATGAFANTVEEQASC